MKKGVILYVTVGKEALPDDERQAIAALSSLSDSTVCLATSEEEVIHCWWHLITRGMHQISCMAASYDPAQEALSTVGGPMRLYG